MKIREAVAQAIYRAAFENQHGGRSPEPGWCWEKCGPVQQAFASKQAHAAITAFLDAAAKQSWQMRPDEATEQHMASFNERYGKRPRSAKINSQRFFYRAMLTAAPKFEWDKSQRTKGEI